MGRQNEPIRTLEQETGYCMKIVLNYVGGKLSIFRSKGKKGKRKALKKI